MRRFNRLWVISFFLILSCISGLFGKDSSTIQLDVDAREATRGIFHARLTIPASPGPLTLLYPKWIPGEHGPTGPIADLAGLRIFASGKSVPWQRDSVDMYAFHMDVPPGAAAIEVQLDYLSPVGKPGFTSGASTTAQLAAISWQHMLLYPKGIPADELTYAASLQLPADWKFGSSLRVEQQSAERVQFKPVSLMILIDSPLITGKNFRRISLNSTSEGPVVMDIVADSKEALQIPEELLNKYKKLVKETLALFGSRHYDQYHFLVTLTNNAAHFGLEHHESSDNRAAEEFLTDEDVHKVSADLLPHEFVHSWNAKYRRPEGLTTTDFHQPMKGDMLWVYEGLTTYLGNILAARSGLWSAQDYREQLAITAADMQQRGRTWRPLEDTAVAAQILYGAPDAWRIWRRGVDFYPEGDLIWLEADVLIRTQSKGRKSLNDFCRSFYNSQNTPPMVKPFTFEDLIAALSQVQPYNWRDFFEKRLKSTAPEAPFGGILEGGWKLVFKDVRSEFLKDLEEEQKTQEVILNYSIGLYLDENGFVKDVVPDSAAAKAGVGPGMKVIAFNERRFSPDIARAAVKTTKGSKKPLELLVENAEFFRLYSVNYQDGERYPHLERDMAKQDVLQSIISPLADH